MSKYIKKQIESLITKRIDINTIFELGGFLYATFGIHSKEDPISILGRKIDEVQDGDFGMWGTKAIYSVDEIRKFCLDIALKNEMNTDDVFLILAYTSSAAQNYKDKNNTNYRYLSYIDEKGKICSIEETNKKVFVTGNCNMDRAFLVKEYYMLDRDYSYDDFINSIECVFKNGEVYKVCDSCTTTDLKYKIRYNTCLRCNAVDKTIADGKRWGIALKLEYPYVVDLVDKSALITENDDDPEFNIIDCDSVQIVINNDRFNKKDCVIVEIDGSVICTININELNQTPLKLKDDQMKVGEHSVSIKQKMFVDGEYEEVCCSGKYIIY